MFISDLSYLNEIEENISGGSRDFRFKKDIKVDVKVDVRQDVKAKGAFNELTFDLYAFGTKGSGTEIVVEQTAISEPYYNLSAQNGTVVSYASAY
ncbi:hypothetical protein C7B76_05905 [filamentous cyanobacterium CCP2]|nr:hypothetical protein C7B76_05905 [filamentous cyanobacterium CCP2]